MPRNQRYGVVQFAEVGTLRWVFPARSFGGGANSDSEQGFENPCFSLNRRYSVINYRAGVSAHVGSGGKHE
jgi:hypothetical protein